MLRIRLANAGKQELGYVSAALHRGGIVCIPTDTVYGLAASALNEDACKSLYALKGRNARQPTAVIFATNQDLRDTLPGMSERANAAIEALLPGPFTLIVRNTTGALSWLCGSDASRIGVRVPNNTIALPPVAATSANLPGQENIGSVEELPQQILDEIACVIDDGPRIPGAASTIIDLVEWETGGVAVVIRDPLERAPGALEQLANIKDRT